MNETPAINNNSKSDDEWTSLSNHCEHLFRFGDTSFVEERYSDAIQSYSTALQDTMCLVNEAATTHHISKDIIHWRFQCFLHRSMAYERTEQFNCAFTDIENALQLYNEFTSTIVFDAHQINLCYRHYGNIAYQLQKYSDAQRIFEKIVREKLYIPNDKKFDEAYFQNYIQQCQLYFTQRQQSQPPKEPIPMEITPSSDTITSTSTTSSKIVSETNDTKITPAATVLLTPKYQYYQNDAQMVIQIIEPNVEPAKMHIQYIDTQNIFVSIEKQGHSITVIHGELYDAIVPDQCSVSYKSDKVVIKLRKERPNYEWQTLLCQSNKQKMKKPPTSLPTTSKTQATTDVATVASKASTPDDDIKPNDTTTNKETVQSTATKLPKPYASHRDWDTIERDVEREMANETPVGDEAMNQLFQQIYANADADTKRAMIKSYQTSGGTVLSTNWKEVAQKDYEQERTAPDGQEWKTWEGEPLKKK
jgi:suppressor of G2 allele of SKP1